MSLILARNEQAEALLNDAGFCTRWTELYQKCPWGTVFQELEYIRIWYRNYKEDTELILIYQTDQAGNLTGLLPISRNFADDGLTIAGGYHSEYQTWLATPENGNAFPEKAVNKLRDYYPESRLQLMFLAPNTPLEWLQGTWSKLVRLQSVPRPLVDLDAKNTSAASLRKRGNKTRIRQLKKRGTLKFTELRCAERFGNIFDQIEDFSRLRLSAIHNVRFEKDKNRKSFHIDLMKETDIVYPTLLEIDDEIASAQVCFQNQDEMLLSITSMSPHFSKQSPSKIHMLMLGHKLKQTKFTRFDLSPGNGYKTRFATDIQESYSLTMFFKKSDFLASVIKRKFITFARKSLEHLCITKSDVCDLADRILHKMKRAKFSAVPKTIATNLVRRMFNNQECRMYSIDVRTIESLKNPALMKKDSISDLLQYRPVEGWQETTSQFHKKVLDNFEKGYRSYTYAENGKLLHYGWLIERQKVSRVYEVDQLFNLPDDTAVLFDYYTHPDARGQGLYQKSILQGLHDAAKIPGIERVFIGVMAENKPSRHVIEKLGFKHHGSLFKVTRFGLVRKWQKWGVESKTIQEKLNFGESFGT